MIQSFIKIIYNYCSLELRIKIILKMWIIKNAYSIQCTWKVLLMITQIMRIIQIEIFQKFKFYSKWNVLKTNSILYLNIYYPRTTKYVTISNDTNFLKFLYQRNLFPLDLIPKHDKYWQDFTWYFSIHTVTTNKNMNFFKISSLMYFLDRTATQHSSIDNILN